MKYCRIILAGWLLVVMGLTSSVRAVNIDPKFTQIVGQEGHADRGNGVQHMRRFYSGRFNYYVDSALEAVPLIFEGLGPLGGPLVITVNIHEMIRQAMTAWGGSFFYRGPRLSEASVSAVDQGVQFHLQNGGGIHGAGVYGVTSLANNITGPAPTSITFIRDNLSEGIPSLYETMISDHYIERGQTSIEAFARMVIRLTVLHEIGHAWGLLHPDTQDHGNNDISLQGMSRIVLQGRGEYRPSIMIALQEDYFRTLSVHLGRPVIESDITLSANDIEGARYMWNGWTYRTPSSWWNIFMAVCITCRVRGPHDRT
jgi:hypothetical protein